MADDEIIAEAKEWFAAAQSAESENRETYKADTVFARAGDQWPDNIRKQREDEGRPCLTIPRLQTFARQVINDARQNSPSIKINPADNKADPDTAEVFAGLIRNIEYTSNAEVAYDTGIESAVNGGFGYWRITVEAAFDDSFDMDLGIARIANPLSVYGDYNSTAADSSDWMRAMVVDKLSKDQFEAQHGSKTATITSWDDDSWGSNGWREDDDVLLAEWWKRTEIERKISEFLNKQTGEMQVFADEDIEADDELKQLIEFGMLEYRRSRMAKSFKVKQYIMTGAEVLEQRDWQGKYIPIVPVYGDEFNIEGKRYFRSLIHPAIDAQRMFNYWRTAATELVALAPRVPYIGAVGQFSSDPNWDTANTKSHPYLEYDAVSGAPPPMRQPLDSGAAAGALQEAMNASDDMKSAIGLYDASLGARSNETSGKAIMARQREGDVSTFHFQDNQSRAIRHTGRILIDLIPHFYPTGRIIRILGEDGKPQSVPLGKPVPKVGPSGKPIMRPGAGGKLEPVTQIHDLTVGKYDVTVKAGPSFTTMREEANQMMLESIRALPPAAPVLLPEIFKTFDWPNAKEIGEKLEAMSGPQQLPPEIQQQLQKMGEELGKLQQENAKLKADRTAAMAKVQIDERDSMRRFEIDKAKVDVSGYEAQTDRLSAVASAVTAAMPPPVTSADAPPA